MDKNQQIINDFTKFIDINNITKCLSDKLQMTKKDFKDIINNLIPMDIIGIIWEYYYGFILVIKEINTSFSYYQIALNINDIISYTNTKCKRTYEGFYGEFVNANMLTFRKLNNVLYNVKNKGINYAYFRKIMKNFDEMKIYKIDNRHKNNNNKRFSYFIYNNYNPLISIITKEMFEIIKKEGKEFSYINKDNKYFYYIKEDLKKNDYIYIIGWFNEISFDIYDKFINICTKIDSEFQNFINNSLLIKKYCHS
jgi:hypothetical protein